MCGGLWEGDKCIQGFHFKKMKKISLGTTDADERIILKWYGSLKIGSSANNTRMKLLMSLWNPQNEGKVFD